MAHAESRLPRAQVPAPGTRVMVEVAGHRIGLYNVAGALYALADRCPHRGAPLCSRGETVGEIVAVGDEVRLCGEGEYVRCPWHKWDFAIATGRSPVAPELRVRRYAVRLDGDEVVVTLDHSDIDQ